MTEPPPSIESGGSPSLAPKVERPAVFPGLAVALGLCGAFAGYAYLAPATYHSSAAVVLSPPTGVELALDPLDAEQRLRVALAKEPGLQPFEITTGDAQTFELGCFGSSAELAQKACRDLSRRVAQRMPELFAVKAPAGEAATDPERQRNAEALVALLAAHPELTSATPAPPDHNPTDASDPIMRALRGERAALEARLFTGASAKTRSDNPYSDPASVDPEIPRVRQRLVQIAKEMDARKLVLDRMSPPRQTAASPELRARWQELMKGAAASSTAERSVSRAPTAKVVMEASLPGAPVTPNRPFLLLIGLFAGVGGGAIVTVMRSLRNERPRTNSRGPDTSAAPSAREPFDSDHSFSELIQTDPYPRFDPDSVSPPVESDVRPPRDYGTNALPDLTEARAPETARAGTYAVHDEADPFGLAERASMGHHGAIEVNAPLLLRASAARETRESSGIELLEATSKVPSGRVTQALGSLIPPVPSRDSDAPPTFHPPTFHPPGYRPPSGISSTYSYVSSPSGYTQAADVTPLALPTPISTPPPPRPSSAPPPGEPISEPRRISAHPSPLRSQITGQVSPRSIVAPHPAPNGWRPDASLVPEARRALAAELYPLAVGQCFVIGVSGVRGAGEDTARVAAELALALAEPSHPRILLLEGNLQRPAIHRLLRIEMPLFSGFSEQLEGRIQSPNQRGSWKVVTCSATLHVIAEGVMRIPELILSRQFEDAVNELRNYYDVIVIDGPLISEAAACRAVQDVVDGVVLVCPKAGSHEIAEASALFSDKRFSTVLAAG